MEKEKRNSELRVLIEPSLYASFKNKCNDNYRTVSEAIRGLIILYLKESK
jgi:hypothetical protein